MENYWAGPRAAARRLALGGDGVCGVCECECERDTTRRARPRRDPLAMGHGWPCVRVGPLLGRAAAAAGRRGGPTDIRYLGLTSTAPAAAAPTAACFCFGGFRQFGSVSTLSMGQHGYLRKIKRPTHPTHDDASKWLNLRGFLFLRVWRVYRVRVTEPLGFVGESVVSRMCEGSIYTCDDARCQRYGQKMMPRVSELLFVVLFFLGAHVNRFVTWCNEAAFALLHPSGWDDFVFVYVRGSCHVSRVFSDYFVRKKIKHEIVEHVSTVVIDSSRKS